MAMNFIIPLALGALQGMQNKKQGQSTGQALIQGAAGGLGLKLPSYASEIASGQAPQAAMGGALGSPVQLPNSLELLRSQFGGM